MRFGVSSWHGRSGVNSGGELRLLPPPSARRLASLRGPAQIAAEGDADDTQVNSLGLQLPRGFDVPSYDGESTGRDLSRFVELLQLVYDKRISPRRYVTVLCAFPLTGKAWDRYSRNSSKFEDSDWPTLRREFENEFAHRG